MHHSNLRYQLSSTKLSGIISLALVLVLWMVNHSLFGQEAIPPASNVSDHPPSLSPAEAQKHFKVAEGLAISLMVSEPQVAQPLSISFDDRGRMWVLQYLQYPNPNGLKAVEMDHWLRTKYESLPDPPPQGPKGRDRISIYEDVNGDGRSDTVKEFVSDLNLASGMAIGHGGVFVVQPPYLLFYADKDRDDVPDGPPQVLLKGFGMEDAHAFANSLTWGPDGWLYGCQGSTATANIRGIGFQQGVWRYHPLTNEFELFGEGGGNSWGVEFDRFGNVYSAGNEVELLVHMVQGGYYVKGFGKHGPLHNPHTYGYFQPVQHHGYVGDSLSGGAVLYQGGALPSQFNHACIAPHTRHSAIRWATVEQRSSTIATRHVGDFVTTDDIWFRPVDMTVGPDGAVYIADWYDYNISHSSPKNRSQWYQPSRMDGRIWRVAPDDLKPIASGTFNLSEQSNSELMKLLAHPNDWYARQARRIFAERRDESVAAALVKLALNSPDQRLALQALWSTYVSGGFSETLAAELLDSPHPYVRAWTVRLLGDRRQVTPIEAKKFVRMAAEDPSPIVRSQLACTAKRLPGATALAIVDQLVNHDSDQADPHIPLLIWWAIEDKAIAHSDEIVGLFNRPELWQRTMVQETLLERISRRFCAEGTPACLRACARLLEIAKESADRDRLLNGMLSELSGRKLTDAAGDLTKVLSQLMSTEPDNVRAVEAGIRLGLPRATDSALVLAFDSSVSVPLRSSLIKALGETRQGQAKGALLTLLRQTNDGHLQSVVISALGFFDDSQIARVIAQEYPTLTPAAQGRAIELLTSRSESALVMLQSIETKAILPQAVSIDQVRAMREMADSRIAAITVKHWGNVQATTPLLMRGRVSAVQQMLGKGKGDAARGRQQFKTLCANCHKLHGLGESIGPDLSAAERKNRDLLVVNVVDPSSVIRQQYISHVALTTDGRSLTGLLAESNSQTITLLDAKNNRTVLNRQDIEQLKESPISLMPENLLDALSNEQVRDLFAFLQSDTEIDPGK